MSEKLNIQPEIAETNQENVHDSDRPRVKHEHKAESESSNNDSQERLSSIRSEVSKQAHSTESIRKSEKSQEKTSASTAPVKRQLQAIMRERTLKRIRKELPAPERALSKFVHAKPVEVVSAIGEKTIARPYGLLGGGLSALVGSIITFYMARNYGFKYNMFLFFTLFIAGYIVASIIEIIGKFISAKK